MSETRGKLSDEGTRLAVATGESAFRALSFALPDAPHRGNGVRRAVSTLQRAELGDTLFEGPLQPNGQAGADSFTLNLGPQHPSTHGVFRLVMQLQGETVVSATPVLGYLHRSTEKLGEARTTYAQGTRVESPKCELGFLLISDGSTNPYRYNVRAPSFVNLTCLSQVVVGHKLADAVAILGSFDIVMGEVDR